MKYIGIFIEKVKTKIFFKKLKLPKSPDITKLLADGNVIFYGIQEGYSYNIASMRVNEGKLVARAIRSFADKSVHFGSDQPFSNLSYNKLANTFKTKERYVLGYFPKDKEMPKDFFNQYVVEMVRRNRKVRVGIAEL